MDFQHPWYFTLFLILPILIGWYRTSGRKKEGTIRISSSVYISDEIKLIGSRKNKLLKTAYLLVLSLLILGLARPRLIDNLQETSVSVIDMLLVLDISSSMLADDFPPNRLEAVKKTAGEFIKGRKEDRIGILVFAGESFIQCPLTVDKTVLQSLIKEITIASKEHDGTAIGMAIANGTNRLRNSDVESRVMILLSDGSNNAGEIDPKTAAGLAAEYDIKIYTIGAGTNQSYTRIPGRGLIRNEIDEETLKHIANVTGGKFFRATDIEALASIYSEIDQLERSEIEVKEFTLYKELYGWFLIPAFLMGLGMETTRRSIFRSRT
ncbi:MAG: VWA domain-containing protein [Candidatus Marinimicrobia bacterium]|jgi:Ca-activated chloride channel family protein|nr:VWA domain-containing protein [Candidatus Neomarinimicrobiota bacterium]MBT3946288.1 VWA domain-containing protein [Candidatus Neomarinimicrobiota bacterium]MBT5115356.1 VWA domain-containing protein [Candidatus Neomarinimicrobiota bacterium]MBT5747731.1 VWA domain-containing protein [Candidatus Neomarinimicrobiota bacterium]MBT6797407.1 VWA domain-containing protein [Candidatus Neomarinimicrobiota bacterium]